MRTREQSVKNTTPHTESTIDNDPELRARLEEEAREPTPEGIEPAPQTIHFMNRVLAIVIAIGLTGGAVVAYMLGGWTAVLAALALIIFYYVLGWNAYLIAALLRSREHTKHDRHRREAAVEGP